MADVGDNNFMRYIYRGEVGELIPRRATHIIVIARVILEHAFAEHPNIVEVICHDGVEKIEEEAFWDCGNLRRVIMPGVKIVERKAFYWCDALTDVECGKLEIIKEYAFWNCTCLRSINLTSVRIVEDDVLGNCNALVEAKFGSKLERIGRGAFGGAFVDCHSLERITIPLKDGMFPDDSTFAGCDNLKHVDLVEGGLLETISALQLEEWRNDIRRELYSINRVLPSAPAGEGWDEDEDADDHGYPGEKARVIRWWITVVLGKIEHYKAKHQRILNEAATALHFALPHDILTNSVLPFLELPSHTFEEEDQEMEDR